jgi:hypothetical protein
MSNFKSQAKRKRELAKLDKRQAKDQKRALRRVERAGGDIAAAAPSASVAVVPRPLPVAQHSAMAGAAPERTPLTLAEVVQRWKNTKVAKPKRR